MCGFCGFADKLEEKEKKQIIKRMADRIVHRGPDSDGYFTDSKVAMGFRRLSIIDLKGGDQPIMSEDKSVVVMFNGEIYNFKELREELKAQGHAFATNSDTEVIVHGYEQYGTGVFNRLRGMFGILIYDKKNETLIAARDFFGIKPLIVGPGIKTGLNVKVENPKEVGADRIVNSVSAYKKYGAPLVVIDFGTATTFNIIDENGCLIGGVIAPGIKTALDSLVKNTAQLPTIELSSPKSVIAKNTETNMQAGIIFGFAGLVDNIVGKIKTELGVSGLKVIATGGLGKVIAKETNSIDKVDRTLTLDGLRIIYELNK